jgi:ABC-2 type transport system ATP-binding protein
MISARGLTKRYSSGRGISNVCLEVAPGEVVGLVGPNGAGKTTLIRLLTGLAHADAGELTLRPAGLDPGGHRLTLGTVQEEAALFDLLTGGEYLTFVGQVHELKSDLRGRRIEELALHLDLGDGMARSIATYSKGMRRKLAFAAALLGDPRTLILDEPFESVDPLSVLAMKEMLRQFARAGTAVLMTSHMLSLVEDVCERFVLMNGGTVRFEGNHKDLLLRVEALAPGQPVGSALERVFLSIVAPARQEVVLATLARIESP